MRIMVTGGAGFIGSHVVRALEEMGHHAIVVDDLRSINSVHPPKGVPFYRGAFQDRLDLLSFLPELLPDAVIHLAAQTSVANSLADPTTDAAENIVGTLRLMEAARAAGVKRFIFASSGGALYREIGRGPYLENDPVMPLSPYGLSKLTAERYLQQRATPMEVVILRLANVYGPGQRGGESGVIPLFIAAMIEGRRPIIYGDGHQTRDYVHVSDVVTAFQNALDHAPGTYNIGTGVPTSVLTLFEMVAAEMDYSGGYDELPARQGEISKSCLNCAHAIKVLDWYPHIALEDGLAALVAQR